MKYIIAKQNAKKFADERKQPVYIVKASKNNHFRLVFDKEDITPSYRLYEVVEPAEATE